MTAARSFAGRIIRSLRAYATPIGRARFSPAVVLLLFALVPAVFVACVRESTSEPETAAALIISPNNLTLPIGASQQLSARGGRGAVIWSSSDPLVAAVELGRVVAVGRGTATIRAVSGSTRATARVTVVRPPLIQIQPAGASFSGYVGGPIPGTQAITVTNAGDVPLGTIGTGTITYSGASGWLTVVVTQGTDGATLTLQPNTTGIAPGVHTATVPITSADNTAPPLTVTFTVKSAPVIVPGQATVTFSVQRTTALPAEQPIGITNGGEEPLGGLFISGVVYGPGASNWLTATIDGASAPTTLRLRPNTTAPAEGTYSATVTLASTMPGVAARTVTVNYTITAAPTPASIALNPANLPFTAQQGAALPAQQSVSVNNGGQLPLTGLSQSIVYTPGQPINWLTVTLLGSVAPTSMNVRPNTTGLAAGTYTARIVVSSPNAPSAEVLVTYTVTLPPQICVSTTSVTFTVTANTGGIRSRNVNVQNCGGGTLTGLTATVGYNQPGITGWMTAFVSSTAPLAPATTPLTINVSNIPPGVATGTVTLSAPGVTSRVINVSFTRIATWTGDVYPIMQAKGCIGCHGTPGNENMTFANATVGYDSVMRRTSPDHGIRLVVVTIQDVLGDSASSYFYGVVKRGSPAFSDDWMPIPFNRNCTQPSSCFDAEQVRIVGVWIQQGARRSPDPP